jgi:hypothetical protein
MAFSSTITEQTDFGSKKVSFGTFSTSSTDTGGDIDTGLAMCEFIYLQHTGEAVEATIPSVNETLPCAGSAVTIVHGASAEGFWWAFGY